MCDGSQIVKRAQLAIRRQMDRRAISLKAASLDSGIPYNTFASYFPADPHADPVQIPGGAINSIIAGNALPADLVSLLLPDGWQIVRAPEAINHDDLCEAVQDYLHEKSKAHHRDSPGGREITDCERDKLNAKVVAFTIPAAA